MSSNDHATGPRALLKRMSRGLVFRRAWPAEFGGGKIYVSPDVALKVWTHSVATLDSELFTAASRIVGPGDNVWDLGSNLAIFAFAAAHLAGPTGSVTAVEADAWLVGVIRRSMRLRPDWARVRLLPAAIAADVGIAEFNIARDSRAANFIGEWSDIAGGTREKQHVISISLDWLAEKVGMPTAMKIDIEGMELEAFAGGKKVLKDGRHRMYLETADIRRDEATKLLSGYGYRFFLFEGPKLRESPTLGWNTIVIPEEQAAKFAEKAGA